MGYLEMGLWSVIKQTDLLKYLCSNGTGEKKNSKIFYVFELYFGLFIKSFQCMAFGVQCMLEFLFSMW